MARIFGDTVAVVETGCEEPLSEDEVVEWVVVCVALDAPELEGVLVLVGVGDTIAAGVEDAEGALADATGGAEAVAVLAVEDAAGRAGLALAVVDVVVLAPPNGLRAELETWSLTGTALA